MSTQNESEPRRERTWLYVVSVVLLIVVALIGFLSFKTARDTAQAVDKATQLTSELTAAGANITVTPQAIARVLGEDGGAVCADPNSALSRAVFYDSIANGAGGPGMRPVITDKRLLKGQLAIIKVYCPDELKDFQQFVDSLQTTNTAA
jgi:hypothetical protein